MENFYPRTDHDRPKRNSTVQVDGELFIIKKVSYTTTDVLSKGKYKNPDLKGCDRVIYRLRNVISDPMVIWIAWCDKIK